MEFQPTPNQLYSDVQKLIGRALGYNPEDLIELVNKKRVKYGETVPTAYIATDIVLGDMLKEKNIDLDNASSFLNYAIHDTGRIVETLAIKYPELDNESLASVMSHRESIDSIALLSLRSSEDMKDYLEFELLHKITLTPEGDSFVIMDDTLLPAVTSGCPAAGSHNGVNPRPIFRQVIPWASRVHLLSDEWHKFRKEYTA